MIRKIKYVVSRLFWLLMLGFILLAWYGYQLGDSYQHAARTESNRTSDHVLRSGSGQAKGANELSAANASLTKELLERGAYLVKLGNCQGCHTQRGGVAFAGGRLMQTEFGQFVTPNITPDKATGIGDWSAEDFWNALHNGKAKGGRLLYPSFPFQNYTHITRDDADAMFAYLQTLPSVSQRNPEHRLSFPYDQRFALAWWRALYFKPGVLTVQSQQSAEWNRGAYLVRGLTHCSACHSSRNSLGANNGTNDFSGGEMFGSRWYAAALLAKEELDLGSRDTQEIVKLLHDGVNQQSSVQGPMAEVVRESLQYLHKEDAVAMVKYLQSLPRQIRAAPDMLDQVLARPSFDASQMEVMMMRGEKIYRQHCMDCHGQQGEGQSGVYPALQGNRSLQMDNFGNPLRVILAGGFASATRSNPRPYSMPPFAPFLDDQELALVLTYIRNAWGNQASVVFASEVNPYRTANLD
ncbi:cytochrome c [Undibacterium fentianense]|uniref:Cytochrome c n=1 Tax=Undibacterium fentianense TaxID=2828728 RepID=A0A941IGH3_9BURK|nr:cytochrome c [Undibacterium fentianense]MBR7801377.1 cytochrome c [Undibacterium fentianense]